MGKHKPIYRDLSGFAEQKLIVSAYAIPVCFAVARFFVAWFRWKMKS
jgi:hypothetical protein